MPRREDAVGVGNQSRPRRDGCLRRPTPGVRRSRAFRAATASGAVTSGGESNLRLPVTVTFGAPSSLNRSPSRALWARQSASLREHRLDHRAIALPAVEAPVRHPRIGDDQRNASRGETHDRLRPHLGFDEDGEVGPPMVEERLRPRLAVDRRELVDRARRQPLRRDPGRGQRDGGEEHGDFFRAQLPDQRDHRLGLADARGMEPDQPPCRPFARWRGRSARRAGPGLPSPSTRATTGAAASPGGSPCPPAGRGRMRPSRRPRFPSLPMARSRRGAAPLPLKGEVGGRRAWHRRYP